MKIVMIEPLAVEKSYLDELAKPLLDAGHSVSLTVKALSPEEKEDSAKDADILIIANAPLSADLLNKSPNVKMISVAFTGVDHVPEDVIKSRGIVVSNAQGYATVSVTELVFGTAITAIRNVIPCDAATRAGKTKDGLVGTELMGKTFGIVGFGAIGRDVAKIAAAFGCNVIAYDVSLKAGESVSGVSAVTLDELLEKSDIVSLHVPLTADTKHLINADKLSKMKPTALLINAARGPVVDAKALADALNSGKLAAAAIDVFDKEPPLDDTEPLLKAKNVVLTPHVGFASKESMIRRADIAFANVTAWLGGKPINVKFGG